MTANPAPLPAGGRQPSAVPEGEEIGARHQAEANPRGRRLLVLSLTALGVVYGDIGTSPLYSIKEAFKPAYGLAVNVENVNGLLSLIAWVLVLIVSVKYVALPFVRTTVRVMSRNDSSIWSGSGAIRTIIRISSREACSSASRSRAHWRGGRRFC